MEWMLVGMGALFCVWCYMYGREAGYHEGKRDALWETLDLQRKLERQQFRYKDIGCPPGHIPNFNATSIMERNDLITRNMFKGGE